MAVIRVNKNKDYTVMSNRHLKEKEMSLKAKGLLSLMLSLPKGWDYSIAGLVAICKENENAIKSTLNELKEFGYLAIIKKLPNETKTGRIEYIYDIFERPVEEQEVEEQEVEEQEVEEQEVEKQEVEKQEVEKQEVEKQGQLNTKELITKELNTKNKKRKKERSYDCILNSVADEELKNLYYEFIKMRTLIKKPMTDKALTLLIGRAEKLAPNNIALQKTMLSNAIQNSWQSIYLPKEQVVNNNGNGGNQESFAKNENKNNNKPWDL